MHLECFGLHCMLRHQKNKRVRDLWHESSRLRDSEGRSSVTDLSINSLDIKMKSTLNSVLKRLDVDELKLLLEAVQSKGRLHDHCIPLAHRLPVTICLDSAKPATTDQPSANDIAEDVSHAVCKAWRWTDLTSSDSLTLLPNCQLSEGNADGFHTYCCVNPYHWYKVIDVISDLKPSKCQSPDKVYLHAKVNGTNSEFTYDDSSTETDYRLHSWCHIAYWELSTRIGQQFPVTPSSIDIFQDRTQGCGVSLDTLHKNHTAMSPSVASVRSKIGAGVTLSRQGHLVFLYNRSQRDVFVTSYCLNIDKQPKETWRVYKVPPAHAIVIYDYNILQSRPMNVDELTDGPSDPHSIHLSFLKGWRGSYSRQTIHNCECWLEILVNKRGFPCR